MTYEAYFRIKLFGQPVDEVRDSAFNVIETNGGVVTRFKRSPDKKSLKVKARFGSKDQATLAHLSFDNSELIRHREISS